MDGLGDKILIMLVGPSATGKSTIMNQVAETDSRFGRVKSFTTRPPRHNDEPDQYYYLQASDLDELSRQGAIVSQVTFPTTRQTYGTLQSSYHGQYNLLDTLANSVDDYRQLPFKSTVTISLTASASIWHRRFLDRYPAASPEAEKRLKEAELSIKWSVQQTANHRWLVNDGSAEQTAQKLIDIVTTGALADDGLSQAYAMLELIKGGDIWLKK